MASSGSSFLSRLSLRRDTVPVLPMHKGSHQRSPPPENHRHNNYDLANLSARAEDSLLFSADPDPSLLVSTSAAASRHSRSPSFSHSRTRSSPSKTRQPPQRVLFAGPPPPIATSVLLYRDVEDRGGSAHVGHGGRDRRDVDTNASMATSSSVTAVGRRQNPAMSSSRNSNSFDGQHSAAWTILQRRERALQSEVQSLLDVQSAGLAAGLGRGGASSPVESSTSNSTRPGGPRSLLNGGGGSSRSSTPTRPVAAMASASSVYATPAGAVVPVRQPRPRKLGLRGARAGLARNIALLADLKAEEGTLLAEALAARQHALAHLRRLIGRRKALAKELQVLDMDAAEADAATAESNDVNGDADAANKDPLMCELATLQRAHASTSQQIANLESQLNRLRARQRTLAARIDNAQSRREAGLSGYRGALKDVDAQLTAVLRRPPLQPLDEAMVLRNGGAVDDDDGDSNGPLLSAPGGAEFLRLRPERRTADMAEFWWAAEAQILERRQRAVERERAALDEGGAVWRAAVQLVTDFETGLRQEMVESDSNGDNALLTPEKKMRRQLQKMTDVIAGLGDHLRMAEDRGWNLLLCAIGAELEAFQEARSMLFQALRQAGGGGDEEEGSATGLGGEEGAHDNDDDDDDAAAAVTPRLAQSTSDAMTSFRTAASTASVRRLAASAQETSRDTSAGDEDHGTQSESDDNNDVPPELLIAHEDDDVPQELLVARVEAEAEPGPDHGPDHGHDDNSSENEVPLEFFSDQQRDGEA